MPLDPAAEPRKPYAANPHAALCPAAQSMTDTAALTVGRPRAWLGSGDARPQAHRPGADACAQLPSRTGNTLRWPNGRVTDLSGTPLPMHVNTQAR